MKFFSVKEFFSITVFSKMNVEMNFGIIRKNYAAYHETGFLTKSILKPFGRSAAMPTA